MVRVGPQSHKGRKKHLRKNVKGFIYRFLGTFAKLQKKKELFMKFYIREFFENLSRVLSLIKIWQE